VQDVSPKLFTARILGATWGFLLTFDPPSATSVTACVAQPHASEVDILAIPELVQVEEVVVRPAALDRGAGARGQLMRAGDEIGVDVGFDDLRDPHATAPRGIEVHADIATRAMTAASPVASSPTR
jgi:hypothetical protein